MRAPGSLEASLESLAIRGGADALAGRGGHGDPGLIFDAAAGNSTMAMFNFNIGDADVLASLHVCSADVRLPGSYSIVSAHEWKLQVITRIVSIRILYRITIPPRVFFSSRSQQSQKRGLRGTCSSLLG